jgi:FkbM family methyltransferase
MDTDLGNTNGGGNSRNRLFMRGAMMIPTTFALCANGRRIYVDPSDERGKALLLSAGDLNPLSLVIWRNLLAERAWTHVIDIGANYGEMLVGVELPQSITTIAVEPNPLLVPYLRRTLEEASLNVEVIAKAVSAHSGIATLSVDREWSGLSSIAGVQPDSAGHAIEVIGVPAITLSSLLKDRVQNRSICVLVKIDVENHEAAVLRGVEDMLAEFEEFAAMVEINHTSVADLEWLLARFRIELLHKETRTLTKFDLMTVDELQNLRGGAKYYVQDAVLRRAHVGDDRRQNA